MLRGYRSGPTFPRRRWFARAIFYMIAFDIMAAAAVYGGYKYGYREGVRKTEAAVAARDDRIAAVYKRLGVCEWFVLAPKYYGCNSNAKSSRPGGNAEASRARRSREIIRDNPAPR